jgi:hypothetical protein
LSEKQNAFLRLLKNKGFKEENVTKFGVDAIGMSTTLESNKSLPVYHYPKHRVYLLREYRRWQNRYWREELLEDLRFEPYTPPVCPWIAVA